MTDADETSLSMLISFIMAPVLMITRTWTRSVTKKVRFRAGIGSGWMTFVILRAMTWRIGIISIPAFFLLGSASPNMMQTVFVLALWCPILTLLSIWQLARRISVGVLKRVECDLPPDPRRDEVHLTDVAMYHSGRLLPEYHAYGILHRLRWPTIVDTFFIIQVAVIVMSLMLAFLVKPQRKGATPAKQISGTPTPNPQFSSKATPYVNPVTRWLQPRPQPATPSETVRQLDEPPNTLEKNGPEGPVQKAKRTTVQ